MERVIACVTKNYANFSARAPRSEYWLFTLFYIILSIVIGVVDGVLGMSFGGYGILTIAFSLGLLIPSLAVAVRRLHDTDRSGWWVLITLIPLIGAIVFIVFACLPGTPGDNRFGPNPLGNS